MLKALRFFGWPLLAGVLIALLIIQRYPQWVGLPDLDVNLQQAPQTTNSQLGPVSYADAVTLAAPAVANLYTTKVVNKSAHPLFEDPQFRRFFGDNLPKQRRMESSLGSAVIMSPQGYLLTNNHVTSGADQIVVALKDGRETLARVIGSDPETDLAVLKIDLKNLPSITLGRSDNIRIGDVALAIGNPFGVGQTVTMGIISATGRNQLGLNNYEDFIQTDAAINPGNSGGALVDANGNLTGINTAIFSKSGGSQGIGFAIPVKLAMEVMKSIIEHGQVIRGWLGIEVQAMGPELADSFGLSGRPGIVVAGIFRDGPAQKAGLQLGDVILSINGEVAADGRRSMNQVARIKPTDKVKIQVMRNGKELTLNAEVGLRPPPATVPQEEP
ncbi:trypsin-like peptidase domain-containing protein [Pseudomonas putida]|uniref:Do family serine endopeptidase AlgW n=1 Tax=Pseudomonas putida TaxID=303 RepID=UPI002363C631|nr:Do family serine endopeptidase AlgW [Pseudomonas putida]MDD2054634.1 trypsin-like peptidase domain-containing protein [Pseudomonas putida]